MTLTLEEAIKHCEEVAEEQEALADFETNYERYAASELERERCKKCASDHRQLAEWLKELKKYRAIFEKVGKILADNGYTIDDLDTIFGKVNREVNDDVS